MLKSDKRLIFPSVYLFVSDLSVPSSILVLLEQTVNAIVLKISQHMALNSTTLSQVEEEGT